MPYKKLIREIRDTDFDPDYQMGDPDNYFVRRSARGLLTHGHQVALLYLTKYSHHKLPGGGIKKDETPEAAFHREIMEETGCQCEILDQSGIVIEWRDSYKLFQISYIFLAKVIGEIGSPNYEPEEIDEGSSLKWVPFSDVNQVLKADHPTNYEGHFILARDTAVVNFYKKYFRQSP